MLFDNRDNSEEEEVSISPSSQSTSNSRRENEADLTEDSSSGGVAIPSAEGDGSAIEESKVSLEDIHRQNEKIIDLLEKVASDSKNGEDGKLRGDVENELL